MNLSPHSAFLALLLLTGCAGPTVKVATPEPIQVDINMRVDVYQHESGNSAAKKAPAKDEPATSTPESRRRNRQADIQQFKDSRLVGEGRDGLLVLLATPPGDYGQEVARVVNAENTDRKAVMQALADRSKRSLSEVQKEQAAEWRIRSFRGEWIEQPQESQPGQPNGTHLWVQKEQ
jgi:uncharacterized protein